MTDSESLSTLNQAYLLGQWHAWDDILMWINTLESKQILKKEMYAHVMSLYPKI